MAQPLLWGSPNPRDSRPLINARSESVATSPLFARAFTNARLLVPADGFFEWSREGGRRQGHYFHQPGGGPFAFAGIATRPAGASVSAEPSAVILTTQASESVRAYHNRMPLIVGRRDFEAWLDPAGNPRAAIDVISAGRATEWTSHPVGPMVNNVRNDGPDCIRFAEPSPGPQGSLF